MSKRMVAITTDSHIGRAEIDFTPYLDPEHRDAYVEQRALAAQMQLAMSANNPLMSDMGGGFSFMSRPAVEHQQKLRRAKLEEIGIDGFDDDEFMSIVGDSDPTLRIKELEADGTAGAVLFSQGSAFAMGRPADDATHWGGIRAHNRWLADFVSADHERWAATIQVDLADIPRCVEEVRWGKEHGLRGGVLQSGNAPVGLPRYNNDYYEPLWAVLEELELPFNQHAALPADTFTNVFGNQRGGPAITRMGSYDFVSKGGPLSHFVFGGVFERFPGLKVVVAESGGADWLLPALEAMEEVHEADNVRDSQIKPHEPIWESLKDGCRALPRRPSEYIDTNVFVQLHAHARDWSKIDELKPDNLMWGSDFPHAESTWPNSMAYLQEQIDRFDVSIDDVETILARNPAKVYGFDLTKLQPVADRIGPTFDNGAPALR